MKEKKGDVESSSLLQNYIIIPDKVRDFLLLYYIYGLFKTEPIKLNMIWKEEILYGMQP
jgi:hypothetical protein